MKSFAKPLQRLVNLSGQRLAPLLLLAACVVPAAYADTDLGMPKAELSAGIHLIHAEVAANDADRMTGLMFRRGLDVNNGMLFVFEAKDKHCMWMKNTLIPLSVAFLDEKGDILNIEEMQPQTTTSHCAQGQALYALEMNAKWFSLRHIPAGTHINGIAAASKN